MAEFTFDGQRPEEEVIFAVKRHPWVLAKPAIIFLFLLFITVFLIFTLGFGGVSSFIIIVFIIFSACYFFYFIFLYNNFIYILTTQRLIIVEQGNIFSRRMTEMELDKLQNITYEIKGPIKTLLGFGDIQLRTAGMDPTIVLENVDNPYLLQQKIIKCSQKNDQRESKSAPPIIR